MLIAVDIGNTSIGVGVFETERLTGYFRIKITDKDKNTLHDTLTRELDPPPNPPSSKEGEAGLTDQTTTVAVASVNPGAEEIFYDWALKHYRTAPSKVGVDIPVKIPIKIDSPERVGVDRLLNAIAAFQTRRKGAIVVDFGTAITFDVVSDRGEYLGGAIAPGIETSSSALNTCTAFLPRVAINKPTHALGKNTGDAISSGVYWGTVGMVERILRELFNELGRQPRVLATGGDAELIAADVPLISETIPHLTLEGIRIVHAQSP